MFQYLFGIVRYLGTRIFLYSDLLVVLEFIVFFSVSDIFKRYRSGTVMQNRLRFFLCVLKPDKLEGAFQRRNIECCHSINNK